MSEKYSETPVYTDRLGEAIVWGLKKHSCHLRKGTNIPYAAHMFAVTALVLESGGTENEAIAAFLHDTVEDTETEIAEVEALFGKEVATTVAECTDNHPDRDDWKGRKLAYIEKMKNSTNESKLLVSFADKYHNISSILEDYRDVGEELWERFGGGRDGTLWYYEEMLKVIKPKATGRLEWLGLAFEKKVNELLVEAGDIS